MLYGRPETAVAAYRKCLRLISAQGGKHADPQARAMLGGIYYDFCCLLVAADPSAAEVVADEPFSPAPFRRPGRHRTDRA